MQILKAFGVDDVLAQRAAAALCEFKLRFVGIPPVEEVGHNLHLIGVVVRVYNPRLSAKAGAAIHGAIFLAVSGQNYAPGVGAFHIHEYLVNARVNAAKFYLKTTAYPNKEIAYRCGFSSESSFCTVFKRVAGLTPQAYRNYGSV